MKDDLSIFFLDQEYDNLKRELAYLESEYNQFCEDVLAELNRELL